MASAEFTVKFTLDDAEASELGIDRAIAARLRQTADKVEQDYLWSGAVMSTDGHKVGEFKLEGKRVTLKGDDS